MADHNTRALIAAVIILLISGILVITAAAVTWQVHEITNSQNMDKVLNPQAVIHVHAGAGLQYLPTVTSKPLNTEYLQPKVTTLSVNSRFPIPPSTSGPSILIPSSRTPITPVNSYSSGFYGRFPAPVHINTTKSQRFPVMQLKPVALKLVPTIKPAIPSIPLPTLLPPAPPKPVPSTVIVDDNSRQVEQRILYYTNIERENLGKPILLWDEELAIIARDHSKDMASRGYFSHINLEGETPALRAIRHGFQVKKDFGTYVRDGVGENIAMLSNYPGTPDDLAKFIVEAWMNSPGHRANLVDSNEQKFTIIGVGVAHDQATDTWYAAQEFF